MDRKALIREYKERRPEAGIFRVRNTVSEKSFIGASIDLPAMLNRQRAQLRLGGHPNKQLQADWNELGSEAFEFEVLDTLTPKDELNYDAKRELRALEELWLDRLEPFEERGYNKKPKDHGLLAGPRT